MGSPTTAVVKEPRRGHVGRLGTTDARISAKRLLPRARAAGNQGSARNFRRAVAAVKREWRQRRRLYRPWVPTPGRGTCGVRDTALSRVGTQRAGSTTY